MLTTTTAEAPTTRPAADEMSPSRPGWRRRTVLTARNRARKVWRVLAERLAAARADQAGNVITDNLAWIVFGVVIIVGIAALVTNLGSDVMNYVQKQLGV